jgi:hypothetical protein
MGICCPSRHGVMVGELAERDVPECRSWWGTGEDLVSAAAYARPRGRRLEESGLCENRLPPPGEPSLLPWTRRRDDASQCCARWAALTGLLTD